MKVLEKWNNGYGRQGQSQTRQKTSMAAEILYNRHSGDRYMGSWVRQRWRCGTATKEMWENRYVIFVTIVM